MYQPHSQADAMSSRLLAPWLFLAVASFVGLSAWLIASKALSQEPGGGQWRSSVEIPSSAMPLGQQGLPMQGAPLEVNVPTDAAEVNKAGEMLSMNEIASPTKNVLQTLRQGGLMMIPIGLCSFLLFVFVFERAISLRRGRVIPRPFVKRFLEQLGDGQLDRDEALSLCEKNRSPIADVFAAAAKKWGRPAVEVEQAILDSGERVTASLRSYLRLFNGITTISPLLGLLGTVLGMIQAFNVIASTDAMGRPELLAEGISEALLATAAGLSVAIPALCAYLFFAGRVDRLTIDIDALGQEVVACISAEALAEGGKKEKSGRGGKAA